ncbi:MAG: ParB/RepB/Spo0J family partition protein [Roseibacillus sp.]|nr:ParB/RepB/Spo0J family partition protein [Roseibacillus sp.]
MTFDLTIWSVLIVNDMAKQALGKGLGALIKKPTAKKNAPAAKKKQTGSASKKRAKSKDIQGSESEVAEVPIKEVVTSPLQPRGEIPEANLEELVESIRAHGVIQPLITRRVRGKYELIAGERRWRASQKLGLATVPVILRKATDREVLEMALVENLQRQDLNAIEEANGYVKLAREFDMKQDEIAKRVGKSRATVANSMRLLDLQKDIQKFVADGLITVGHAKAILGIKVKRDQRTVADQVMRQRLTVRATEKVVQKLQAGGRTNSSREKSGVSDPETEAMLRSLTSRLREHFTTHVSISHSAKKGRIELEYYGNDDLGRLLELLGVPAEEL